MCRFDDLRAALAAVAVGGEGVQEEVGLHGARRSYISSVEKLRRAIGEGRYDHLMNNGELIAATPDTKARALLAVLAEYVFLLRKPLAHGFEN